jgi:hypothetical protein
VIDVGLLLTMVVALGLPAVIARWWQLSTVDNSAGFFDVAIAPAFAGLAAGRLVAVTIDDPTALSSVSDLLIVRSGVEFWPGVAAAAVVAAWSAHRSAVSAVSRLGELAPLALVGYAGYEAACLVRDGCFGPDTAIGLSPPGTATTMLPIGVLAAAVVAVGAAVLHREQQRRTPSAILAGGFVVVAAVRSIGSVWLPHIGAGPTRQQWSSIVVALVSGAVLVALSGRAAHRTPRQTARVAGPLADH